MKIKLIDNKFDLDVWRNLEERIAMVLDPACPESVFKIVVQHDLDMEVVEAVGFNPNCPDYLIKDIAKRLNITEEDYYIRKSAFVIRNDDPCRKVFCGIPWNHVATNANGTIRMCCQMIHDQTDGPSYGTIYKEDGSVLRGNDDINANRNAPAWKKIRKQFMAGEKPTICQLCWDEEDAGIHSKRLWADKSFPELYGKAATHTKEDGSIDSNIFPIQHWDLRFGNKCNLACRSCGPTDSDQWYDDWAKWEEKDSFAYRDIGDVEIIYDDKGKATVDKSIFNWYDDSPLWKLIEDSLDEIKMFYFTGGEPTINVKHRELLQIIIDRGFAQNIILHYNTNMAGIPNIIFKFWKEFKEVHLGMSIDGIYEHFEYIRHLGKWEKAYKSICRVDSESGFDNITASFTSTISIMNVLHLLDMQWWMKEQGWNRIKESIVVHNLYGPWFYNIQNMPIEMKKYVRTQYEQCIMDMHQRWPADPSWCNLTEIRLRSVLAGMDAKEPDLKQWYRYFVKQEKLDEIRKQNWKTALPELYDMVQKLS